MRQYALSNGRRLPLVNATACWLSIAAILVTANSEHGFLSGVFSVRSVTQSTSAAVHRK